REPDLALAIILAQQPIEGQRSSAVGPGLGFVALAVEEDRHRHLAALRVLGDLRTLVPVAVGFEEVARLVGEKLEALAALEADREVALYVRDQRVQPLVDQLLRLGGNLGDVRAPPAHVDRIGGLLVPDGAGLPFRLADLDAQAAALHLIEESVPDEE